MNYVSHRSREITRSLASLLKTNSVGKKRGLERWAELAEARQTSDKQKPQGVEVIAFI